MGYRREKKKHIPQTPRQTCSHPLPSRCCPLSTHTHGHRHPPTHSFKIAPTTPFQTLTLALSPPDRPCARSHHYNARGAFQAKQLNSHTAQPAPRPLLRQAPPPPQAQVTAPGTHRLRVQAGRSPGSATSPRPPQSSDSPAQVQAAEQGARGPAAAVAGSSRSSSSSSHRRRRGGRRGAPSAPRTGRAILSGARCELRAPGLRGPGRPRAQADPRVLSSALGSAPGHGRRHKFPLRRRLRLSAGPRCQGCSAAPGGGRDPRAHPGRPARARCEPHRSGSAGAPRPPAALRAGFWAPAHAKCRRRRKDGDQPRSLRSATVGIVLADPLAQQQTPGCAARPPAHCSAGRWPSRSPGQSAHPRAGLGNARLLRATRAQPTSRPNKQPAARLPQPSPGRSPRPRPRPRARTHPPDSAPRGLPPAHVGGSATAPRHAHASRSLAAGAPRRPTRAALGALVAIPPLRPLPLPRPALFSHPRCEGRGDWEGKGGDGFPLLKGTR